MESKNIIVNCIDRVYKNGLTTTSGGNLSVMDYDGNIWITPSGKDKGTLKPDDICKILPNGEIIGEFKPSIELPFHSLIYKLRPDIKAVLHVHSPYLVTYSLFNNAPPTDMLPTTFKLCGKVGTSKYDIPGSMELGGQIAKYIDQGYDSIMMENHGVVLVAPTMEEAYVRLEALENCAKIGVKSIALGKINTLTDNELSLYDNLPDIKIGEEDDFKSYEELEKNIKAFSLRCYNHDFFEAGVGSISVRVDKNTFLITPSDYDRGMDNYQIAKIVNGVCVKGKAPKEAEIHLQIYSAKEYVNSIFIATPPNTMAYAVTGEGIDSRTIPESYINMRDVLRVAYGKDVTDSKMTFDKLHPASPILIVNNAHIITTGETIVKAFDRLEVTEVTANTLITAKNMGNCTKISDCEIDKIDKTFNLPKKA